MGMKREKWKKDEFLYFLFVTVYDEIVFYYSQKGD